MGVRWFHIYTQYLGNLFWKLNPFYLLALKEQSFIYYARWQYSVLKKIQG